MILRLHSPLGHLAEVEAQGLGAWAVSREPDGEGLVAGDVTHTRGTCHWFA